MSCSARPVLVDESPVGEIIETRLVRNLLLALPPREERVVRLRYWRDMTLKEIGRAMNVSVERARGIECKARRRMAESIRRIEDSADLRLPSVQQERYRAICRDVKERRAAAAAAWAKAAAAEQERQSRLSRLDEMLSMVIDVYGSDVDPAIAATDLIAEKRIGDMSWHEAFERAFATLKILQALVIP